MTPRVVQFRTIVAQKYRGMPSPFGQEGQSIQWCADCFKSRRGATQRRIRLEPNLKWQPLCFLTAAIIN